MVSSHDGEVRLADPASHPDWDVWTAGHEGAQFFHGRGWAQVLQEAYGHRPLYPCRLNQGGILEALPLMEVESPLTGRRGVSLPFTDFCSPLGKASGALYDAAMDEGRRRNWRYLECRGDDDAWRGATPSLSFHGHEIDLRGAPNKLFDALESSVRRGVRRAKDSGLSITFGQDMGEYFRLHCLTRQRHGLPPQPWRFFDSIRRRLIDAGHGWVVLASEGKKTVAGAVFLTFGKRAFYKYGASDLDAQGMRPNNLVMWSAMERFAQEGFTSLHMGRTSLMHDGLRRFKLGFGAQETTIQCRKYDFRKKQFVKDTDRVEGWHTRVFGALPIWALKLAGKMLYPHLS